MSKVRASTLTSITINVTSYLLILLSTCTYVIGIPENTVQARVVIHFSSVKIHDVAMLWKVQTWIRWWLVAHPSFALFYLYKRTITRDVINIENGELCPLPQGCGWALIPPLSDDIVKNVHTFTEAAVSATTLLSDIYLIFSCIMHTFSLTTKYVYGISYTSNLSVYARSNGIRD